MRRLPIRRLAPLVALLVTLAACSSVGETPAATVNGDDISVSSVRSELKIIRGNRAYRAALERQYQMTVAGESKGTFDAAFTAQLLTFRIWYERVEQTLEELDIAVKPSDERSARSTIKQQVDTLGPKVWSSFPQKYRDLLGHQEALIERVSEEAGEGKIARDYFNRHKDEFQQICVSHILINTANHSDADAERLAEEAKAELDGGADFATVAREKSEDPGTKDNGGDLDCDAPGRFVDEFDKATQTLPIGEVSDPVKTTFGYHLILVRSRSAATFDDVKSGIGERAFQDFLLRIICGKRVDIDVNPSYGEWDRSPCKGGNGLAQVSPPSKPKTNTSTAGT
jgi:foldase protein PrsA